MRNNPNIARMGYNPVTHGNHHESQSPFQNEAKAKGTRLAAYAAGNNATPGRGQNHNAAQGSNNIFG